MRVHEPLSVIDLLDAGSVTHSWNLNEAMKTIAGDRQKLDSMRARSLDKIQAWSIPAAARGNRP